jgi:predicted dinucleotide-binding enzyme
MSIGIIGAGNIGVAVAKTLSRAGIAATIANSRGPDGDDSAAKAEVAALIDRLGFAGIDLGSLAVGGNLAQFAGGPLPNQNLVRVG